MQRETRAADERWNFKKRIRGPESKARQLWQIVVGGWITPRVGLESRRVEFKRERESEREGEGQSDQKVKVVRPSGR